MVYIIKGIFISISILWLFFKIYKKFFRRKELPEAQLRKARSIEILKEKKIPYIESLPAIEDTKQSFRRDVTEVARRALALFVVASKAEGADQAHIKELISMYDLDEAFTKEEQDFICSQDIDEVTRIQFWWRHESFCVLLWALGFIKTMKYPDQLGEVFLAVTTLVEKTAEEFLNESNLRDQIEIIDQADLIYRYDWAVRDAQIKGREAPQGLDSSVVLERHYALNWLIQNVDWDEVSTDT